MKTLKLITLAIILFNIALFSNISKAKEIPNPNTLRLQIYKEFISLFEKPIPLIYEDKNLKGETFVSIVVANNGKLFISDVEGENNVLNNYVCNLFNSRNLWTNPDLAGTTYNFKIISK
ncbi:MAG: hypothetical protein N2490_00650 [Ignavibacteria bacterium]|nr:hypothetical protein [Ignavibacteria bacterium]